MTDNGEWPNLSISIPGYTVLLREYLFASRRTERFCLSRRHEEAAPVIFRRDEYFQTFLISSPNATTGDKQYGRRQTVILPNVPAILRVLAMFPADVKESSIFTD
jgi:hypothetical protein